MVKFNIFVWILQNTLEEISSVCLSVGWYVFISVCLSVCLSVCSFVCLSACSSFGGVFFGGSSSKSDKAVVRGFRNIQLLVYKYNQMLHILTLITN